MIYEHTLYKQFKKVYKPNAPLKEQSTDWQMALGIIQYSKFLNIALKTQAHDTISLNLGQKRYCSLTCSKGRVIAYKESIHDDEAKESIIQFDNHARESDVCARLNVVSRYYRHRPQRKFIPIKLTDYQQFATPIPDDFKENNLLQETKTLTQWESKPRIPFFEGFADTKLDHIPNKKRPMI
jgi:hypothetical protein